MNQERTGVWRSRWAAIGAAVAVTLGAGGLVATHAASTPSVFVPVTPQRVLDTRFDIGLTGTFTGGQSRTLDVTGAIPVVQPGNTAGTATVVPNGATAIVANVTAVRPTSTGYVSVRPGDATGTPTTSTINIPTPGGLYPNSVTVEIPTTGPQAGTVDLFYFADTPGGTTHLLLDIVGYYTPGGTGSPGPTGPSGPTGPAGPTGPVGPAASGGHDITVVASGGAAPSIATGPNGTPVVSHVNSTSDLLLAVCLDTACRTVFERQLETAVGVGVGEFTSIVVNQDGLPVVAYYDSTNDNLKIAACTSPKCIGPVDIRTLDAAGDVGRSPSIALGANGNPVISYQDTTNGGLKIAACSNPTCTSTTSTRTIDNTGSVGPSTSIAIGANGFPVISYQDATNFDLKVAACANATCTSATITTVDSAGNVGQNSSITIGNDGNPVIAYYDVTNGRLKIARCANPTCTSATTSAPTGAANGFHSSITIGDDNRPVIAFLGNNFELRVAACVDPTCSAATVSTVNTGATGITPSIVIGASGNPTISSRSIDDQSLLVATCGNPTCAPYPPRNR
jgi:hypothetical protein